MVPGTLLGPPKLFTEGAEDIRGSLLGHGVCTLPLRNLPVRVCLIGPKLHALLTAEAQPLLCGRSLEFKV